MEGLSYEATSLAGHLCLDNLLLIYDDNKITIDGSVDLSFSEDVRARFKAIGWDTVTIADGNTDLKLIDSTLNEYFTNQSKPTIIILKTKIGHESLLEGTSKSHGAPMGEKAVKDLKKKLGFDENETFEVKSETSEYFEDVIKFKEQKFQNKIDFDFVPPF